MCKTNKHGNNSKIRTHILSDETMILLGFSRANSTQSWLYVQELTGVAEFWFEVWGEGEDDFCIEVLEKYDAQPYDYKYIRSLVEDEMNKFVRAGVITGYIEGDNI